MPDAARNLQLNPAQQEVMDRDLLGSGFSCVLQLPTGAGKTWLAERAIGKVLDRGGRAIYLTPLRALATELVERWATVFDQHEVGVFTGEYGKKRPYPVPFARARLLVMTPERLDACTRHWRTHWAWLPEVDLVVVDELHLLGEPGRGPRLEGALGRLRRLNPFIQLVGLSATLGNAPELSDWAGGVYHCSDWRPMPVEWRVLRFRRATDKPQLLIDAVLSCAKDGGQSLVFVQSRRRAEQLSALLGETGLVAAHHHAGLESDERRAVESRYRARKVDVLISTGTLEMGVNLPARQVLLYDLQRFNGLDFVPLSVNTVWQRAGRAGRRGLDDKGQVVLLAPTWDRQAERYLKGNFEAIDSHLGTAHALAEQLLAEVASGLCRTRIQLKNALSRTLASHQGRLKNLDKVLEQMLTGGMLAETRDEERDRVFLKATRLGRIAVRQMLAPATILLLSTALESENAQALTFFDLLVLAVSTADCDLRLPADFEEIDLLVELLGRERSTLLSGTNEMVIARLGHDGRRLLSVVKTALVARAWTRVGDADAIAEEFGCYRFEVRRVVESLERILTASVAIVTPPKPKTDDDTDPGETPSVPACFVDDEPTLRERVGAVTSMVAYGLDEEAVTLTFLKGVGGTLARRLHAAGVTDIEELALSEADEVSAVRGISTKRAQSLIDEATEKIGTRSAVAFKETGRRLQPLACDWPDKVDPYRLRRALELKVRKRGSRKYIVTGGLEPHRVDRPAEGTLRCDCADFAKGNECKHLLAVRLERGDRETKRLSERLADHAPSQDSLDLFQLWFDRSAR